MKVQLELERHTKRSFIMAAPPLSPQINVYAPLPLTVKFDVNLNVDPSNWRWVHCLSLPLDRLNALQLLPILYKWIRYVIGVIIGAIGDLSTSALSPNAVDYSTVPPAETAELHYHISDDEKRRMFPVDPHIARTDVTSSVHTSRRAEFRAAVSQRDGNQCILTGCEEDTCDAAHLLSHSKGNTVCHPYFQSVSAHHCNRGSTLRLILGAAVEKSLSAL